MAYFKNIHHHAATVMLLTIAMTGTSPAAAQNAAAPITAPTTTRSPQDQELLRLVQQEVAQQVEQLKSDSPQQREQAQRALAALHRQLLPPLETAARAQTLAPAEFGRLLTQWDHDIGQARIGTELGPELAAKLRQLRDARPDLVARFYSDDPVSRCVAVGRLWGWPDPQLLGEPLIVAALRDAQRDFDQYTVYRILNLLLKRDDPRYLTPAVMNELLPILDGAAMLQLHRDHLAKYGGYGAELLDAYRLHIAAVLSHFEDDRLPPLLLAVLVESQRHARDNDGASLAVDGLVKNKAVGAIPALMKALETTPLTVDNRPNSAVEMLVYAVLRLSGQSLDEYEMKTAKGQNRWVFDRPRFADDKARAAGVAKLQTWWKANRDKPPHDTAKRIDPAEIPRIGPEKPDEAVAVDDDEDDDWDE